MAGRSGSCRAFVAALRSRAVGAAADAVRRRIYLPDPMPADPDWGDLDPPERVRVETDDGLVLHGYRWRAALPGHDCLLFLHGNAGNAHAAACFAAPLRRPDREVIVASYRGYGDNPGRPSEAGLYRDGAAFLRLARRSRPRRLHIFGFSLGAGVALRLAARHRCDAVVTLGAFTSLARIAPRWAGWLLPDRFDNVAAVRALRAPLLLLHGECDEVVPQAEAFALAMAARPTPRVFVLRDAPHVIDLTAIAPLLRDALARMPADDPSPPHRAVPGGGTTDANGSSD